MGLGDWAVLMRKQQSLEIDDFLTELRDSGSKRIILGGEQFHLRLKVGKPLLLSLATLERRNPTKNVSTKPIT